MKTFTAAVLELLILCHVGHARSFSLPSGREQKVQKELLPDGAPAQLIAGVLADTSAILDTPLRESSRETVANLCDERPPSLLSYEEKDITWEMAEETEEFPWFFLFSGSTKCGGTLISPKMILTAAHCFSLAAPSLNLISKKQCFRPKAVTAYRPYNVTDRYEVEVVFVSENYQMEAAKNRLRWDMAVVVLKRAVYNKPDVPCFNPSGEPAKGDNCWSIGKGLIVNVQVATCPDEKSNKLFGTNFHLCAAEAQRNGDSGGPVICKNQAAGGYYIAGVMSEIKESADGTKSGLLTNMMYRDICNWVMNFMSTYAEATSGDSLESFCDAV